MLHFVNHTKTDFVLKLTDDGFLCLCKKGENEPNLSLVKVCGAIPEESYDEELFDAVRSKMNENGGVFDMRANRSSKFYVSIPDVAVLYDEGASAMVRMFGKETGLRANEYYFPKSAIFLLTEGQDMETRPDMAYEDEAMYKLCHSSEYRTAPMYRGMTDMSSVPGITITTFLCNLSKWDKIPSNTFITVSEDMKLRVGVVTKKNPEGTDYSINALIRCDAEGNELKPVKKENRHGNNRQNYQNGNGNRGGNNHHSGKKGKNKKSKRMESLRRVSESLPVVNNGWD